MPLNSHFVSRFLTAPWEHGDRMLWYYDFREDRIRSASSRSLFARQGTNSAEVEARLNRLVETPIAAARERLWAPGAEVTPDLEWPLYRALALLLFLQPFRATESRTGAQTLEEMVSRADTEIDGLTHAIGTRWQLMRITVSNRSPLAYPDVGYFPLLGAPMGGKCSFGFAIPISPIHAFIGVPRDVRPEQIEHWSANGGGFLSNYSVGHQSRILVLHPSVVESLTEAEIARAMRGARAGVLQGIALCGQIADVLRQMDAVI
jgi:hypothetical protein